MVFAMAPKLSFHNLQDWEQSVPFVLYLFLTTKYSVLTLSIILSLQSGEANSFPV